MNKIIKKYPIVCPSCSGSGMINDYLQTTNTPKIQCPACHGDKTIICTEEYETDLKSNPLNFITKIEAAEILGLSLPCLASFTKKGIIKGLKIGNKTLYNDQAINDALQDIKIIRRYQNH